MDRFLAGAAAGLAATVPMTLTMKAVHRRLPVTQRYPAPPRRITMRAASKAGVRPHLDETGRQAATVAAHYGYGAAAGALYGFLEPMRVSEAVAAGVGYGLLVWAGSYLGAMPALGLHPSATREPAGRNLMMIAAHVAWGATLGAGAFGLRRLASQR